MEVEDQEEAVENPTLAPEITVWKVVANKIIHVEVAVEVVDMEIVEEVEVRKLFLRIEILIENKIYEFAMIEF